MAKVGIVMGSDSDMPIMAKAAEILDQFGIDYEMTIISAHREPDIFFEWAKGAESRGVKVIIAGAGKAAHLPGMCAAIFPMPVIGIPMKTSDLGGVDSLYSIVQMPSGIPVATVAINGGANAGILAAKILAASDEALLKKVKDYAEALKNDDAPQSLAYSIIFSVFRMALYKTLLHRFNRTEAYCRFARCPYRNYRFQRFAGSRRGAYDSPLYKGELARYNHNTPTGGMY